MERRQRTAYRRDVQVAIVTACCIISTIWIGVIMHMVGAILRELRGHK